MKAEKWKQAARGIFSGERAVKLAVLLGICGIGILFISGLGGRREKEPELPESAASSEIVEYQEGLEGALRRVVKAITGEENPTVLVTLESGSRYLYAQDEKQDAKAEDGETDEASETVHVVLKDADGAQHALTVTEIQPKVKGVVIVSGRAEDPAIREKLVNAVKTALDISSSRVCVTDTG